MKISIGADHRGVEAMDQVARDLQAQGHEIILLERGVGLVSVIIRILLILLRRRWLGVWLSVGF